MRRARAAALSAPITAATSISGLGRAPVSAYRAARRIGHLGLNGMTSFARGTENAIEREGSLLKQGVQGAAHYGAVAATKVASASAAAARDVEGAAKATARAATGIESVSISSGGKFETLDPPGTADDKLTNDTKQDAADSNIDALLGNGTKADAAGGNIDALLNNETKPDTADDKLDALLNKDIKADAADAKVDDLSANDTKADAAGAKLDDLLAKETKPEAADTNLDDLLANDTKPEAADTNMDSLLTEETKPAAEPAEGSKMDEELDKLLSVDKKTDLDTPKKPPVDPVDQPLPSITAAAGIMPINIPI